VAEVTNELMYGLMIEVREQLGRVSDGMSGLEQELISVDLHLVATQNDIANICAVLGRQEAQLERIERRLGLVEVP
jgi:hypothetical protein